MKFSICIPIYDMPDGEFYLSRAISSVLSQNFEDYEIVISDDSSEQWFFIDHPKVRVIKHTGEKGMANNTNHCIDQAKGEYIKILYQDDYFADDSALMRLNDEIEKNKHIVWLATGCIHSIINEKGEEERFAEHYPEFTPEVNSIGSPSVITIHNSMKLRLDPKYKWVLDLDWYKRITRVFGDVHKFNDINVVIGIGNHQVTSQLTTQEKLDEEFKLIQNI